MDKEQILIKLKVVLTLFLLCSTIRAQFVAEEWTIPVKGNSFITKKNILATAKNLSGPETVLAAVGRGGIILKNDTVSVASTYIYIPVASNPTISLNVVGTVILDITCGDQKFSIPVDAPKNQRIEVGELQIKSPQYIRIDFRTHDIGKPSFVVIHDVILSKLKAKPLYITNSFNSLFGLQGASVYLCYNTKPVRDAEWIYNEILIPEKNDIADSYFGAQSFDGGYVCLENNPDGQRTISFSVWNTFDADNDMPPTVQNRASVVSVGENVKIRNFDRGGKGKQCVCAYNWKAGSTYKFLLHATHPDSSAVDYTAYFKGPEDKQWNKVATIRRPHIDYHIMGFHSFIANDNPRMGFLTKSLYINNVWVKGCLDKQWHNILEGQFTNDDTGRRGIRVDYEGGVIGSQFYLKTGGFFGNGSDSERNLKISESAPNNDLQMENWLENETDYLTQKQK